MSRFYIVFFFYLGFFFAGLFLFETVDKDYAAILFQKSSSSLSDSGSNPNKTKCRHRIRKSCSKCRSKILGGEDTSLVSDTCSVSGTSVAFSDDDDSTMSDGSLALVPVLQTDEASSSDRSRWTALRRLLPRRQRAKKSDKNLSVILRVSSLPLLGCSVIYPDQKQQSVASYPLDGESGAIVPFGYSTESLPKELLGLNEKFSDKCRLFSFRELSKATSDFTPGFLFILKVRFFRS